MKPITIKRCDGCGATYLVQCPTCAAGLVVVSLTRKAKP